MRDLSAADLLVGWEQGLGRSPDEQTLILLATAFETWTLLKPGPAIYTDGMFDVTATLLMGTNPSFRKAYVQVREPLEARDRRGQLGLAEHSATAIAAGPADLGGRKGGIEL